MKHPIWSDETLAQMLKEVGQEAFIGGRMWERSTGKTTAAILEALLTATRNPHMWVLVDSNSDYSNTYRGRELFRIVSELVRPLPHTIVRLGNMRTTPPRTVHGDWPQHSNGSFVWVKFGSDR